MAEEKKVEQKKAPKPKKVVKKPSPPKKAKVKELALETHQTKKNVVQFTKEILKDGYGVCTPVINGEPCPSLKFGYCGDADYEAASKMVAKVISATEGDVPKSMSYIMQAAKITEAKISPDEQVEIEGVQCIIDYKAKTVYDMDCQPIADVKDMKVSNPEAIKLLLIERAKPIIEEWDDGEAYEEGYDDGYEDGYEDGQDDVTPEDFFKKFLD